MPLILPTAQNMAELLVVHHTIAKVVRMYPKSVSMGAKMPTREVRTRGSRQYPSTDAERDRVRMLEKCDDPIDDEPGGG